MSLSKWRAKEFAQITFTKNTKCLSILSENWSQKSKEPRKQWQYPSVGKVLHKLELPTHILHSRGFSAVQLTKPWEKKTLLRQDHPIIALWSKNKKQTRPKAVQLTKPWEKKTFLRQNHLIIVIRADKKIPSEMEVAPRYNCWHCWHCWHCSTLFDTVDMTYNE